ncbi:MAG: DivIVA domain-containing protein, partial [Lacisediminihabitans sp.]
MATDDEAFTTAMRGYNRDEVDSAIQDLRRELIKANTDKAEAAKEVKRLTATVEDLQAEIEETGSPTYSGLGSKLENILRVAEEQSTRLISQADIDAEKLRNGVQGEIHALRVESMETAEKLVADAHAKSSAIIDAAHAEAAELLAASKAEGEVVTQDALREAAAIRGAVATEAAEA